MVSARQIMQGVRNGEQVKSRWMEALSGLRRIDNASFVCHEIDENMGLSMYSPNFTGKAAAVMYSYSGLGNVDVYVRKPGKQGAYLGYRFLGIYPDRVRFVDVENGRYVNQTSNAGQVLDFDFDAVTQNLAQMARAHLTNWQQRGAL